VKSSKLVLRGALCLSLALFSLFVIEVAPSHWLVLLDHSENGIISYQGNLTVTGAYKIILFGLCTGIISVLLFLVGGNILLRWTTTTDADDNKNIMHLGKKFRGGFDIVSNLLYYFQNYLWHGDNVMDAFVQKMPLSADETHALII